MYKKILILLVVFFYFFQNYILSKPKINKKIQKIAKKFGIKENFKEKIHLQAGAVEIRELKNKVILLIGTQGVHIWQGNKDIPFLEIICDNAVIWLKKKENIKNKSKKKQNNKIKFNKFQIYAEGNVIFRWKSNFFIGKKIYFDLLKNKGIIENGSLRTKTTISNKDIPLQLRAKKFFILSQKKFKAKKIKISTCQFAEPHYYFSADEIIIERLKKNVYISSRENKIKVLGNTIFYLPYISGTIPENIPLKSIKYGHSSKWGHYLLTKWGVNLYQDKKAYKKDISLKKFQAFLDVDLREKRGIALGPMVKYEGKLYNKFKGKFFEYYIWDQPLDDLGSSFNHEPEEDEEARWEKRYRIYWLHRQKIPNDIYLDIELSYITDEYFLPDFFEKEYREEKEPESYIYLKKYWDNFSITFLSRYRFNDFQTQNEYLPQGKFYLIFDQPFPNILSNLFYSSTLQIDNIRKKDADNDITEYNNERIFRTNWENTIYYKLTLEPFFILPFFTSQITYYERGKYSYNLCRFTEETGIEVGTNIYRYYSIKSTLFNINNLLHIITPHFKYKWVFANSLNPSRLIPFDSLDTIEEMQEISIVLTNRLKTLRDNNIVDFLFLELEFNYYPERDLAKEGIEKTDQGLDVSDRWEKFDNLKIDFKWSIRKNLNLDCKAEFNFQIKEIETLYARLNYNIFSNLNLFLDTRYYRKHETIGTIGLNYIYNPKWAFYFQSQYDFQEYKIRELTLTIHRVFHRFALDIKFSYDQVDDNTSITANFYPLDLLK